MNLKTILSFAFHPQSRFGRGLQVAFLLYFLLFTIRNPNNSFGILPSNRLTNGEIQVAFPAGAENFVFPIASKPALQPTRLPIQWELGFFRKI
jgi:hypothetical protein